VQIVVRWFVGPISRVGLGNLGPNWKFVFGCGVVAIRLKAIKQFKHAVGT